MTDNSTSTTISYIDKQGGMNSMTCNVMEIFGLPEIVKFPSRFSKQVDTYASWMPDPNSFLQFIVCLFHGGICIFINSLYLV